MQIDIINYEIRNVKRGILHGKPLIDDPMESIVEAHVSMLEWPMQSRKFGVTAFQLELLQQKSIEVLESLKSTFPEKNGVTNGSIPHKVRELILFGWSENFSTQGPEHCHIHFVEKIAHCTNNTAELNTIITGNLVGGPHGHLRTFGCIQ